MPDSSKTICLKTKLTTLKQLRACLNYKNWLPTYFHFKTKNLFRIFLKIQRQIMRKLNVLILGLFLPLFIFSQKNNDSKIASAINILKIHQTSLDNLSPFDEGELEDIVRLNRKVNEQLGELLQLDSTGNFPKENIPFFTAQSEDQNFAIFSWEENMGGTYRPFINLFYWKNKMKFLFTN